MVRSRDWLLALILLAALAGMVGASPIGTYLCPIDSILKLRPKIVDLPGMASATVVPPLAGRGAAEAAVLKGMVSPASDTVRFTVFNANLWLLPAPWARDIDGRMERFPALIASLSPDLIALQEVWLNPYLALFRRAFPEYWAAGVPPFVYNRSGLVVFSRFPILDARYGVYPWTRQHSFVETLARKGFLQVDLLIAGRVVRLIDTHLYASRNEDENVFPVWQFEILRRLAADPEVPILLAGDLNIRLESLRELNDGHFTEERMPADPEAYRTTVRGAPRKIDYILHRAPDGVEMTIESRSIHEPIVSDHLPVLGSVTIRFKR